MKRPAEKRLILCLTVPVSGNYTPFSGPSDIFSDDLVMDGPETGEYLADKWEFIAGDTENRNSRKTRPFYSICQLAAGRSFH